MQRIAEFIKSILAGIMISIGGVVYLASDNKYVGALLFSTGLITVVAFKLNLYTGKIGYVLKNDGKFFIDTILSIFGNLIGCAIVGFAKSPAAAAVCAAKLNKEPWQIFVDAALCGILIFVCVDMFKTRDTFLGILICIPTFIIAGFEHSIADMFYFINARSIGAQSVIFIVIAIIGNAVGGLLIPTLLDISKWLSAKKEQ